MDAESQKLTRKVMRRVYAIWFLRQMAPILVAMPLSLGIVLWLTAKEFFVAKIVENFILTFHSGNVFAFIGSAFYSSTHLLPLAIIGILSVLSLILGYKLVRNFMQMTLVRI